MNKKKFIKKLKNNLSILEENEINDIIDEYSDIIDEKIKNGKSEEEAINDFGDINELSKEILKAYKINPKFAGTEENSELYQDFENVIKKGAKKLSNFTKNLVEDIKKHDNITLELICEIIIKIIILLVIYAVLAIPFWALLGLGHVIFDIAFFPLDTILNVLWGILVWILYFVVGIIIAITMFKNNIKSENPKNDANKASKKTVKKENIEEIKTEKVKKDSEEKAKKKEQVSNNVLTTIKTLIKILVFIFFILPIIFIIAGLIFAIVGAIYYLIIGLNLWGILILLLGLTLFFIYIYLLLKNLFNQPKSRLGLILTSMLLIAFGSFLTFDTFKNIEIIDSHHSEIKHYEYLIGDSINIKLSRLNKLEYKENEEMEDGYIIIEVYYNDNYVTLEEHKASNNIIINSRFPDHNGWKIYDEIIDNLKDNKIIDYEEARQIDYIIYGNSKTLKSLKIR